MLTEICHHLDSPEKKEAIRLAVELQRSGDEENQLISIQLIAKMTPDMTQEEAEKFFTTEFAGMYPESSVRLKKEIIHSSCQIAKSVSKDFLNTQIISQFFL